MPRRLLPAVLALLVLVALPAAGAHGWGTAFRPVAGNPADRLLDLPLDPDRYDRATRCRRTPTPGAKALVAWLERNVRGESWGVNRCERWGPRSYSVHAEGRAVDWHLDVVDRADRRAARRLVQLLLAPDRAGNPRALARRMGIQGIIWDCRAWWAGGVGMRPFSACFDRRGRRIRVDRTTAHRDHVHLELSRPAARLRTSFWQSLR